MRVATIWSVCLGALLVLESTAFGLHSLQLGPGTVGVWNYDVLTQTWVTGTNPFSVNAYANSDTVGANGDFAWDPAGATDRLAYLVVSAIPMVASDMFDVTVENDGGALVEFASGFGAPPIQDPNSLAPHGIFDTYFEIYQFDFDGALTTIFDTQPGELGSGEGSVEEFEIAINDFIDPVFGVHMDLLVVKGDGTFDPLAAEVDKALVNAFAPFSHDAQTDPGPDAIVPEPSTFLLSAIGLCLLSCHRRRRR